MATKTEKTEKKKGYVTIRLFKDELHSAPEKVCLNGVWYGVPRGVDVEVPEGVAEILKHAEQQRNAALDFIEKSHSV